MDAEGQLHHGKIKLDWKKMLGATLDPMVRVWLSARGLVEIGHQDESSPLPPVQFSEQPPAVIQAQSLFTERMNESRLRRESLETDLTW